jgi:hypothetical protein
VDHRVFYPSGLEVPTKRHLNLHKSYKYHFVFLPSINTGEPAYGTTH